MADLFDPEPAQWGLRGDPYVWRSLKDRLATTATPTSLDQAAALLHATFHDVVGVALTDPASSVRREEFAHGGMSSGMVDLNAWRERLMPMLVERARANVIDAIPAPNPAGSPDP